MRVYEDKQMGFYYVDIQLAGQRYQFRSWLRDRKKAQEAADAYFKTLLAELYTSCGFSKRTCERKWRRCPVCDIEYFGGRFCSDRCKKRDLRRMRPELKAAQNRRYLEKIKNDPKRYERRLLQQRKSPKPPKPPKPKQARVSLMRRAARNAILELTRPKRAVVITQRRRTATCCCLALPVYLPPSIRDAISPQIPRLDREGRPYRERLASHKRWRDGRREKERERQRKWYQENRDNVISRRNERRKVAGVERDKRREQSSRYRETYYEELRQRHIQQNRRRRIDEIAALEAAYELNLLSRQQEEQVQ